METPKNIEETTITTGNIRVNISSAGVMIDTIDSEGKVESTVALAWREIHSNDQVCSMDRVDSSFDFEDFLGPLVQVVDLPVLCKVG